ncbi:putative DFG5 protein [Microdochium trichocladiopsis]|uniref:Mannan endo-1,6-alpha-mannosidase n=1 Tax=Microdochium trichocladiopsis TaxID=1682393 RepID=A0A9P9BU93_9PEZI|nr:putative DFG5 protein [Microdochium trichocladiopsis]KAH7037229.1 putative DFG5 protein [Microdochium trichocladiopsis]
MTFYTGHLPGQTPGLLPEPYYWWEGGALMGALIHYWHHTGDSTYNAITTQGLLHQVGPDWDYMPPNQTLTEGNDDQGFWGMAVMTAAEFNFPNPPKDQPQWLALAQAVFNTQAARWDMEHCNGGLRWQIFPWNNGFDYKNSISQACFFNIAARLALYTGNATYAQWAIKTWDWMKAVNLMDDDYRIYDGVHINDGCVKRVPFEFSYNVGAFLHGSAAMWALANKTGQAAGKTLWRTRIDGLMNATELVFFWGTTTQDRVMIEVACEPVNYCNKDQQSFKAYLSRWMSGTTKWAPWTFDRVKTLLGNSATAAVQQCVGGSNGQLCGLKWANNSGQWDGTTGVGQQMAAMEVVLGNMIEKAEPPPLTNSTGGTSPGNPSAGTTTSDQDHVEAAAAAQAVPVTTAERVGAIIGTVAVIVILLTSSGLTSEHPNPETNGVGPYGYRGL